MKLIEWILRVLNLLTGAWVYQGLLGDPKQVNAEMEAVYKKWEDNAAYNKKMPAFAPKGESK